MEGEVKALYSRQIDSLKTNNPKTPIDTQAEYDALIAGLTKDLRSEESTELGKRRRELNSVRQTELADLKKNLSAQKKALKDSQYRLDTSETRVSVSRFEAEGKKFPMIVESSGEFYEFTMPVTYKLKSGGRQEMLDEYYRIYSAAQSDGLAGEITYKAQEVIPDLWLLKPSTGRVLNLLEKDAVLTRATGGRGMVVSTAGELEVQGAAIRLESGMGQAELWVNGKNVGKTPYLYTTPAGKDGNAAGRIPLGGRREAGGFGGPGRGAEQHGEGHPR